MMFFSGVIAPPHTHTHLGNPGSATAFNTVRSNRLSAMHIFEYIRTEGTPISANLRLLSILTNHICDFELPSLSFLYWLHRLNVNIDYQSSPVDVKLPVDVNRLGHAK